MNGFPTTYIWDQRLQIIQIQLIMDEKIELNGNESQLNWILRQTLTH